MSDAPERIWLDPSFVDNPSRALACNLATARQDCALPTDTQYTRSDLCITRAEHDRQIATLTAALAEREAQVFRLLEMQADQDAEIENTRAESDAMVAAALEGAAKLRRIFPILSGGGAGIDYQLVANHAEQVTKNHYQTVDRLAERGGLSWSELYAVLHNQKWRKIETNEAMIACLSIETHYLAAMIPATPSKEPTNE